MKAPRQLRVGRTYTFDGLGWSEDDRRSGLANGEQVVLVEFIGDKRKGHGVYCWVRRADQGANPHGFPARDIKVTRASLRVPWGDYS